MSFLSAGTTRIAETARTLAAALSVSFLAFSVSAQESQPAPPPPAPADAKDKDKDKAAEKEAPLPSEAHVAQSIELDGKPLRYTVTVGTLPVFDQGKKTGEVVYTAYIVDAQDRPVTFAMNGST